MPVVMQTRGLECLRCFRLDTQRIDPVIVCDVAHPRRRFPPQDLPFLSDFNTLLDPCERKCQQRAHDTYTGKPDRDQGRPASCLHKPTRGGQHNKARAYEAGRPSDALCVPEPNLHRRDVSDAAFPMQEPGLQRPSESSHRQHRR